MSKTESDHIQKVKIWWLVKQARLISNRLDYEAQITKTPCHFGGYRCWFKCPLYKDNKPCGRRVGILYLSGNWFGCRHCYDLTYKSRNLSGKDKRFGNTLSFPELTEMRLKVKSPFYRGRPTKKYLQYLNKEAKTNRFYVGMANLLGDRADKIKNRISSRKNSKKDI